VQTVVNTLIEVSKPSSQQDPKYLARFITAQNICFSLAGGIAAVVLLAWIVPDFGASLPQGWSLMKANTALVILFSIASLILAQPKFGAVTILLGKLFGGLVLLLSGTALYGHLTAQPMWLDTLVAADSDAEMPGRMSVQTAMYFVLLGITLMFHHRKETTGYFFDALIISLIVIVMIIFSGYLFGALHLFGHSLETRTSPHTLASMLLLLVASIVCRLPTNFFSIFTGIGIGSHIARISILWTIALPFIIISMGAYSMKQQWLSMPYAAALSASTTSILLFSVVLWLARKINKLELDLRDKSLTDELTRVHNRRGFYLIGEHMLFESRRNQTPLTVLYFDVDGLKEVNDNLGHEAGSQLLQEFANLLRTHFRHNDEVARIGGDEFAVLLLDGQIDILLRRLANATAEENNKGNRPYRISYSVGQMTSDPEADESFTELVTQADANMYEQKRRKKDIKRERKTESRALLVNE
jgi:diguanylate cyclase (GGDEF)-like protein